MSVYLALSRRSLSRLRYHWFWGLEVDDGVVDTNMDEAVHALRQNSQAREALMNRVVAVWEKPWLIRAMHWALNWDGYRQDYYLFQCDVALALYEQEQVMGPSQNEQPDSSEAFLYESPGLSSTALSQTILNHVSPDVLATISSQMTWFQTQISPYFEQVKTYFSSDASNARPSPDAADNTTEADLDQQFTVTDDMLPSLSTLGFSNLHEGDALFFKEVKTHYFKLLRRTHPDKGGNATDFLEVKISFDSLMKQIHENATNHDAFAAFVADFSKYIARQSDEKLRAELQAELDFLQEAKRVIDGMDGRIAKINETWDEIAQDYKGIAQDYREMAQDYREIQESLNRHDDELDQLQASQLEQHARIDALLVRVRAAQAGNDSAPASPGGNRYAFHQQDDASETSSTRSHSPVDETWTHSS